MLRPLHSARIADAATASSLPPTSTNYGDPVDLMFLFVYSVYGDMAE